MCMNKSDKPYKAFDDLPLDSRKKQIEACFRRGLTGESMPGSMTGNSKKHEENVKHLEATLTQFTDLLPSHRFMRRIKDRLEQEKLWLKHYSLCAAEHKKGRERLTKLMTSLDLTTVVDIIVKEEKAKDKAKAAPQPVDSSDGDEMKPKQFVPMHERVERRERENNRGRWFSFRRR